jgi:hypothetical protein
MTWSETIKDVQRYSISIKKPQKNQENTYTDHGHKSALDHKRPWAGIGFWTIIVLREWLSVDPNFSIKGGNGVG